jgi:tRNA modification GTPase
VRVDSAAPRLRVATKADLMTPDDEAGFDHMVSAITGEGLDRLTADIAAFARRAGPEPGDVLPWKRRHVELLEQASQLLCRAVDGESAGLELRSEDLRLASQALGRIVGDVDVEDLLDEIFSSFCIGK